MKYIIPFFFTFFAFTVAAQTDGENLFDDSFLHEIHFTDVDTAFFLATKDYQTASVTIDGNAVADIGFKRKGNISGYPETNKYGIKVKTNKYVQGQEYDGIKEFTLHMNYQDPTMLREKLTYEICRDMGLFSLRTAFAKVYIDDVYFGLYTIVEGKDEMYKQVFDNRDADAMESIDFGDMCYEGPNISDYEIIPDVPSYFHDNGDYDTAWARFIEMLDKVNNTPDANYVEIASQYLNLADFFTYQAVNVYLLNMDSYIGFVGNQRYVYDENAELWQVTPWDFNASFGLWDTGNATVTDYPLFPGFSCFGNKVNDIPELKNYYLDAVCKLTNDVCDPATMGARIDVLKAQIQQAVYDDYRKVVSNADFDAGTEFGYNMLFFENQPALKTVLEERHNLMTQALADENFTCTTAVTQSAIAGKVSLSPNPATDILYLETGAEMPADFTTEVYDVTGKLMPATSNTPNELSVSGLQPGIYFLVLKTANATVTKRFVKK